MTRTDVMASSGPRTAATVSMSIRRSRVPRALALLAALVLALAPAAALAAGEPTSGYTTSSKTTTTTVSPSSGVSPSKEEKAPAKEVAPTPTSSEKATTLPFTGFDLRWAVGLGVLLVVAGTSIIVVQRRQRAGER
jgi:hypothetical protein